MADCITSSLTSESYTQGPTGGSYIGAADDLRAEQIMTRVLYYRLDGRVARLHDAHCTHIFSRPGGGMDNGADNFFS